MFYTFRTVFPKEGLKVREVTKWLVRVLHFLEIFCKSIDPQTHSAPHLFSLRSNKRGSDRGFAPILAGAPLENTRFFQYTVHATFENSNSESTWNTLLYLL